MKYFICSMSNDGRKNIVPLLTDSVGQLEKFAEDHDQPGRAVYACVNPLTSDATAREKGQVAAIVTLHIDIDFKRLATPPDEVRRKILELPLSFEVRETGGGLHVLANLKEAYENETEHFRRAEEVRTQIMTLMCGDPAPNHSAALLRVVGTHNSKYGEPFEVSVVRAGEPVDITDVEAFLELYSQPLFEVKEGILPTSNVVSLDVPFVPIDYEAVLADMPTTGEGINAVQYRLLRALLVREGMTPQEAVDAVVNATMDMAAAHHPDWTAQTEMKCATSRMNWVLGCLQKEHWQSVEAGNISADTPPGWLPAEWHEAWIAGCRAGGRPHVHRNGHGYCIRTIGAAKKENEPPPVIETHQKKTRAGLTPFAAFDPTQLPARDWMYGRHYQRGTVSLTVGTGGRGKTSLVLVEVIAMALCKMLLGEMPNARYRVWVHCGEDDMNELRRRVAAICQHYKLTMKDLEGWLFLTSANEFPLRVVEGYNELKIDNALIAHITAEIEANMIDLAVFDPLVTLHGSSENDAGKMARVIDIFKKIASQTECAIELVHHTRKATTGSNGDHDAVDMRGSSAVHDAARAVRVLNIMNEKEAEEVGIPAHERSLYVRVDRGKGNFAPPRKASWIHLANVDLPNGDEVGVVEPWDHPGGAGARTDAGTERERDAERLYMLLLRRANDTGNTVGPRSGKRYAPSLFAREQEAVAANLGKVPLEKAQARLFTVGRIRTVTQGTGGKALQCIVEA